MKKHLTPEKLTGLYALFLLTVFLLWTPATGYSPIVAPKHRLFLVSAGVYFGGLAVLWLLRRPKVTLPAWSLFLTGGLLLCFFLSSVLSAHQDLVWLGDRRGEGFLTLTIYLGIFLAMAAFGKLGKPHRWAAAVTSIVMFLLVLAQFWGKNPLGLYPSGLCFHDRGTRYSGEYLGTIGNSDLLSALLTMLCLYLLGAYATEPGRDRWFFLLGSGCAWGALLLSEVAAGPVAVLGCLALALPVCVKKGLGLGSMGQIGLVLALGALGKSVLGYEYTGGVLRVFFRFSPFSGLFLTLALICAAATVLLRHLPEQGGYPRAAKVIWALYLLVILVVLLFLFFYTGSNEALGGFHQLLRGHPPDTLGSSRIAIWKEAVELGRQEVLLGGGPDTYNRRSELVFTRELESGHVRRNGVDVAHNEYLNLWVNTGLPSMLLFLALIGKVLTFAIRKADDRSLSLLLPSMGYAIHALFGISQSLVSPLYYLFLGALVCTVRNAPENC